jgi:hypothetical protein
VSTEIMSVELGLLLLSSRPYRRLCLTRRIADQPARSHASEELTTVLVCHPAALMHEEPKV